MIDYLNTLKKKIVRNHEILNQTIIIDRYLVLSYWTWSWTFNYVYEDKKRFKINLFFYF